MNVVEAKDLSFSYQGMPLFSGVSFTVEEGDFVALIGANGAGKSTLLKLMLGELSSQSGSIHVFGQPVREFRDWPRLGYVPQGGTALAESFPATAREVVSMGLYGRNGLFRWGSNAKAKALAALNMVEMDAYADAMIGRLSGGQIQRVLIARALAGSSDALLLDEPTTGVDSQSTLALYELLETLNREQGVTIIMVTHDIARSTDFVSRTLCLEEGSLVELDKKQIAHEMEHKHRH